MAENSCITALMLLLSHWMAYSHGQQCTKFNWAKMGSYTLLESVPGINSRTSGTAHVFP